MTVPASQNQDYHTDKALLNFFKITAYSIQRQRGMRDTCRSAKMRPYAALADRDGSSTVFIMVLSMLMFVVRILIRLF